MKNINEKLNDNFRDSFSLDYSLKDKHGYSFIDSFKNNPWEIISGKLWESLMLSLKLSWLEQTTQARKASDE